MKAIFLDKDGTLIPNVPYSVDPDQVNTVTKETIIALIALFKLGYKLFIVTNQSGVARGYCNKEQVRKVSIEFYRLFRAIGICLEGFYFCPHHPDGQPPHNIDCNSRKPNPGMLLHVAKMHSIDLEQSWMIGDILDDVQAGRRAGCKTILLDNGGETEWKLSYERLPHHIADNLLDAVGIIAALQLPRSYPQIFP